MRKLKIIIVDFGIVLDVIAVTAILSRKLVFATVNMDVRFTAACAAESVRPNPNSPTWYKPFLSFISYINLSLTIRQTQKFNNQSGERILHKSDTSALCPKRTYFSLT